ncbi:saccharopine dehydrogenase family protein [Chroogloeocystis siderophila]|jgi:short subunit dehydrogenase-like uncharacterized protein|uniref:Saccharopine dehydrogenase NADP binding domain-containing protein n=1 Tax=Chroogloeocystis siderophila 5.2 s.c.1 TaxID=247279 RepID=A0A1U7HV51_9CHRO|nr:saccharopine dehydrogenase NADP-binding domain-containing protein [Chroogloeocystis siderophila]OKH27472.1 hypothetical protein NIES1031_09340 [Chroogloeocystis siderophila 5.2 s.c.1]
MSSFLLYGANGYTGELITRLAVQKALTPILAGRNPQKIAPLATELGLEYRTFTLEDTAAVDEALADVPVVLNCAGPFSQTAKPLVAGCLRTKTHYLDITGEVAVFEAIASQTFPAQAAEVMLLPGVGFDVVPSDCLAAHLKTRLPNATQLTLAFQALGKISRGTATTMVEAQGKGGLVRRNGVLTSVPAAWNTRTIDFGKGVVTAVTIPWGDVSTAFYSTGIPNIEVYAAFPTPVRIGMVATRYLGGLLSLPPVQNLQKRLIQNQLPGPSEIERTQGASILWGEVTDDAGKTATSRLQCPEGYTLTTMTAVEVVSRVLAGQFYPGFQTPSLVYGADFILDFEGVVREDLN